MSSKYNPVRTNKTPWTDSLSLITQTKTTDSEGYETVTETTRTIFCTFLEGVNRAEFYEASKNGIRLSAEAECWQNDYQGELYCTYNSTRYKIVRSYETGRGTVSLSLSEVLR